MEKRNDITDDFLDDEFQYAEWIDKHQEFLEKSLDI